MGRARSHHSTGVHERCAGVAHYTRASLASVPVSYLDYGTRVSSAPSFNPPNPVGTQEIPSGLTACPLVTDLYPQHTGVWRPMWLKCPLPAHPPECATVQCSCALCQLTAVYADHGRSANATIKQLLQRLVPGIEVFLGVAAWNLDPFVSSPPILSSKA